jgi:ribosomal protein S18 acetylase RimI-like enzyme
MNTAARKRPGPELRPATPDDLEAIATLWHSGWRDGHLGHVPAALLEHRRLEDFRQRVPERLGTTTVAVDESGLIGFVTVREDELEQLYVAARARGSGAARQLTEQGEKVIAGRFELAWLAVATGNARARRFYERNGWYDAGDLAYQAQIAGGSITVPCRRYEKHLKRDRSGS